MTPTPYWHDPRVWQKMPPKTLAYWLNLHVDHPHTLDRESRNLMLEEAAHRIFDWESPEGQADMAAYLWKIGQAPGFEVPDAE